MIPIPDDPLPSSPIRSSADRNESADENVRDDQQLAMVPGQRGKMLLLVDGYTLPRNNVVGTTTYWCCRFRRRGYVPCNARATTTLKPNGLYKLALTQPKHNHLPTFDKKSAKRESKIDPTD